MASNDNAVARARMARDLTQTELARRAGISRQALGAIESGAYHPGVAIAIRLARELGSSVESLFGEVDDETATLVDASWLDDKPHRAAAAQSRVVLARVRGKVVAVPQPAARLMLAPAAGLIQRAPRRHRVDVCTFRLPNEIDSTILMSGCDPAVAILADWLARRQSPVNAVAMPCSSQRALRDLVRRASACRRCPSARSKEWRVQLGAHPPRVGPSPLDSRELCALGTRTGDGAW